jgi:HSP20 family protein
MENNNGDILPMDWFNRFFNLGGRRGGRSLFDTIDILRDFDDMHKEMNRMFNVFNDISKNAPKELIREYETSDGGSQVRKVGPIVYGYSMTIGPDGKPHVQEFGNVKPFGSSSSNMGGLTSTSRFGTRPEITAERATS